GLDFVHPVSPEFMQRSDLQSHMQKIFEQETSEDEMRLSDASLKAFGFVPPEFKTEETMLSLLSEEVAGFYDPKSKEIFLIREPPRATKPGLLARLLGAPGGFNKDENKA